MLLKQKTKKTWQSRRWPAKPWILFLWCLTENILQTLLGLPDTFYGGCEGNTSPTRQAGWGRETAAGALRGSDTLAPPRPCRPEGFALFSKPSCLLSCDCSRAGPAVHSSVTWTKQVNKQVLWLERRRESWGFKASWPHGPLLSEASKSLPLTFSKANQLNFPLRKWRGTVIRRVRTPCNNIFRNARSITVSGSAEYDA